MSVAQVQEAWDRIEDWCGAHFPALLDILNPGAKKDQIAELEHSLGRKVPDDLRASLQRHDGQPSSDFEFLFGQLVLSNCQSIAEDHARWSEYDLEEPSIHTFFPANAIAESQFDKGWIPVADENGTGNYLAVDTAPGPAGTFGQVFGFGADIYHLGGLGSSWGEFLLSYARLLESGLIPEISQDLDLWSEDFEPVFDQAGLEALVLWAKAGRWPMAESPPA